MDPLDDDWTRCRQGGARRECRCRERFPGGEIMDDDPIGAYACFDAVGDGVGEQATKDARPRGCREVFGAGARLTRKSKMSE